MKKLLIATSILFSSLMYGQKFIQLDLNIWSAPANSPDSLLVEVDTILGASFQAAYSFYMPKTNPSEYTVSYKAPITDAFFNRLYLSPYISDILIKYPCGAGDTIVQKQYNSMPAGPDTTILYTDTLMFCPGTGQVTPPNYNIHVRGEVNSSGQIDPVNDHTYLMLLGDNGAGVISIIDSLFPSASGNSRTFANLDSTLMYTVVAIPQGSHAYLFQNNLPTYLGNESNWQNAVWKYLPSTGTVSDTITLVSSSPTNGNGSAGGNVNGGSPRGNSGDPVEGMLMILTDISGMILDFEFTDANGDFLFELLDDAQYRLFGERYGKVSDVATFDITASNMHITGLDFEETDTEILYQGTVSVETHALASAKMYPNPVQNELRIKLLETNSVQVDILDLQGRVLESASHKNTNEIAFPMGHLNNGVYLVRLTDQEGNQQTSRIVKL